MLQNALSVHSQAMPLCGPQYFCEVDDLKVVFWSMGVLQDKGSGQSWRWAMTRDITIQLLQQYACPCFIGNPFSLGFSFMCSRPVSGAGPRVVSVRVPAASNTLSSSSKPQPIASCEQCVVRSGYRQPSTGHSGQVMHTVQQLPQIMKPAIAQRDYCLFFLNYNIRMKNERGWQDNLPQVGVKTTSAVFCVQCSANWATVAATLPSTVFDISVLG